MPAACRSVGVPLRTFAAAVLSPAVIATIPAALVALLVRGAVEAATLPTLTGASALVGSVYVLAFLGIGLRPADRARYLESLRGIAPDLKTTHAAAS